jgi:MFS family permease
MPVFADAILHQGPKGLGLLMASTGVGALGGALTLAARSGIRGLGRLVAMSAAAFGVTLGLFAFSHTFWLSTALLIPVGAAMMVQMASCNTLLQAMVPDMLRGRVMSIYSMMLMGMSPIGSLLAGAVAERIGAPWTVAIGGAVTVASAAVFATRIPHFRAEARQLIATQGLGLHS